MEFLLRLGYACHLWLDNFWVKMVVFLAFWLIFYLFWTPIWYIQAILWLKGRYSDLVVKFAVLLGAGSSVIVCMVFNGFAVWWTSPLNVYYVPFSAVDPGYTSLWMPFIIVSVVATVLISGIWYELHAWRKQQK